VQYYAWGHKAKQQQQKGILKVDYKKRKRKWGRDYSALPYNCI